MDTDGRLLLAGVPPADRYDSHGKIALLCTSPGLSPFLARRFADRAYPSERRGTATTIAVKIVESKRSEGLRSAAQALGDQSKLRLDRLLLRTVPQPRGHPDLCTRLLPHRDAHDPRRPDGPSLMRRGL